MAAGWRSSAIGALWIIDADGSHQVEVSDHPAGNSQPRWSPDGRRIAFLSRRRGWSQAWLIDAPIPHRGRPASHPRPAEPVALTPTGRRCRRAELGAGRQADCPDDRSRGRPAGARRSRSSTSPAGPRPRSTAAGPGNAARAGSPTAACSCCPMPTAGSRSAGSVADLARRTVVTSGAREHGDPSGGYGIAPLPSPDGRFSPRRDPRRDDGPRRASLAGSGRRPPARRSSPGPGVWRPLGWSSDSAWVAGHRRGRTPPPGPLVPARAGRGRGG